VGALYDVVKKVEAVIERKGLPLYKTKGQIAMKVGIVLSMIEANTPDDPVQIANLKAASREILGEII